ASLVVRDRSYVVERPPSQVTVTDGPTVRSVVRAPTPGIPPPRKVCWFAVSRRRYRKRALIMWTIAPPAPFGGLRFQLADPDGHSRLLVSRSEEHTSELQSLRHLVCRLLLEKKKPTT